MDPIVRDELAERLADRLEAAFHRPHRAIPGRIELAGANGLDVARDALLALAEDGWIILPWGRHDPVDFTSCTRCIRCGVTLFNVDQLRSPCPGPVRY